jgi:hypothetical protein
MISSKLIENLVPSSGYAGDCPDPLWPMLCQEVCIEPQLLEFLFPGGWFADANWHGFPSVLGLCLTL